MDDPRFSDPFWIGQTALESYRVVAATQPRRLPGFKLIVCTRLRTAIEKLRAMPTPRLP